MRRFVGIGPGILFLVMISLSCTFPVLLARRSRTVRGSGEVIESKPIVRDFSRLIFAGQGDVFIMQGGEEALRIEAEENLIDYLEIEVRDSTLFIGAKRGIHLRPTERMRYYLTMKDLAEITLSGSGVIQAEEVRSDDLILVLSGLGDIVVQHLDSGSLEVDLSGSGNVELAGDLEEQTVTISGSGDYLAGSLDSAHAFIHISGSGTGELRVDGMLEVLISGSGIVNYYGNPRVNQSITGSGSVDKVGD